MKNMGLGKMGGIFYGKIGGGRIFGGHSPPYEAKKPLRVTQYISIGHLFVNPVTSRIGISTVATRLGNIKLSFSFGNRAPSMKYHFPPLF